MDVSILMFALPLVAGVLLDKLLGDPLWLPHPVVGFGKLIAFFEHRLNHGTVLPQAWLRSPGCLQPSCCSMPGR